MVIFSHQHQPEVLQYFGGAEDGYLCAAGDVPLGRCIVLVVVAEVLLSGYVVPMMQPGVRCLVCC